MNFNNNLRNITLLLETQEQKETRKTREFTEHINELRRQEDPDRIFSPMSLD